MNTRGYVLVTPAHNEADYISRTMASVLSQRVLPEKWIIVNDRSTDATSHVVRQNLGSASFIELVERNCEQPAPELNPKVLAFKDGLARLQDIDYAFIGNLDADIELPPDYYATLLGLFATEPQLGICGGALLERNGENLVRRYGDSAGHVPGAIQLFRRTCFEQVNGFYPARHAGEDTVMEFMARMHGWEVRSFQDLMVVHLRTTGATSGGGLRYRFRDGLRDYANGNHPLYELAKCVRRIGQMPPFIGSAGILAGYCWGYLSKVTRPPHDVVRHVRKEQLQRLTETVFGGDS